jgi:thiol-disulfide isomerase/thioredoxin
MRGRSSAGDWTSGLGIAFLLVAIPCGCQSQAAIDRAERGSATRAEASSTAPAAVPNAAPDVRVQVAAAAALQQLLRKHAGRVVLIDFWATWCGPCKQLFPHVVALHRELADQGLAVISVSLDDPDHEPEVLRFLQQQDAGFANLISQFGTGSQSADAFDLRGDVPMYKLYDRAGQLRYQFSGEPSGLEHGEPLEKIEGRVKELLAESQPRR